MMRPRSQRIVASDGVVGGEVVVRDGVIDSVNATGAGSGPACPVNGWVTIKVSGPKPRTRR